MAGSKHMTEQLTCKAWTFWMCVVSSPCPNFTSSSGPMCTMGCFVWMAEAGSVTYSHVVCVIWQDC